MLQRFSAEDEGEFFCECPLALCARRVALDEYAKNHAELRQQLEKFGNK